MNADIGISENRQKGRTTVEELERWLTLKEDERLGSKKQSVALNSRSWMRSGKHLAPMLPDMLKRIMDEAGPGSGDLDPQATSDFRQRRYRKSGLKSLLGMADLPHLGLISIQSVLRGLAREGLVHPRPKKCVVAVS